MDVKLLLHKNKYLLFFLILFFINIGFKEVFRLFEETDLDIAFYFFSIIISIVALALSSNLLNNNLYYKVYCLTSFLFLILFVSSFTAEDTIYGIQKCFLGLLLPLLLFSIFIRFNWSPKFIYDCFIFAVIIIIVIAIPYKISNGLFIRSTSFGLLGSIPFGWVNGMSFIIVGLKQNKKVSDYFLMLVFILMIIWTGSKGPLLAMTIIILINFNKILGDKISTKIITFLLLFLAGLVIFNYAEDIRSVRSIIAFFNDPEGYTDGVGRGSIGTRSNYIGLAFDTFLKYPIFGAGFGSFAEVNFTFHQYPHNIYLEMLAEGGIISLIIFLLILLKNSFAGLGQAVLFMLICLSFSGDISYFRYAFFPLLISSYINNYNKFV